MVLATVRAEPGTRSVSKPQPPPPQTAPEPLIIPVAGVSMEKLHSNFSEWRGNHRHEALDILAPRGTPVLAAVDGSVRKLLTSKAGGLTIYEADISEQTIYYYAHLDHYAAGVEEGMLLHRGDVIGYVGTTGNAPPNTPHLHFAIVKMEPSKRWWKGTPIDPFPLLRDRGITVSADRVALGGR